MKCHGAAVRAGWLRAAVRELQLAAGDMAGADAASARGAVMGLRARLPDPRTPVERCLLEHFLHKAALAALSPGARSIVRTLTSTAPPSAPPLPSSTVRVRRLLETRFVEPWTVDRLAKQVGCRHRALARRFRAEYGTSIHSFLTEQRVSAAMALLADERAKVEAVSVLVGYRSKKNFYAEFRRLTGVTPAQFRSRSASMAIWGPPYEK
jgi:AraC family transcriptional regulator, activator of mtrCDE